MSELSQQEVRQMICNVNLQVIYLSWKNCLEWYCTHHLDKCLEPICNQYVLVHDGNFRRGLGPLEA